MHSQEQEVSQMESQIGILRRTDIEYACLCDFKAMPKNYESFQLSVTCSVVWKVYIIETLIYCLRIYSYAIQIIANAGFLEVQL
jgi:hypothetical protein